MSKRYAIIQNICNDVVSINFSGSQKDDFVLEPGETIKIEATQVIEYQIQYGEIAYHIQRKRLRATYTSPSAEISLADLIDCDGYGTGHNNVVRGDDPRIQTLGSVAVEEVFTLTNSQITILKYIILTYTPIGDVSVFPEGGIEQFPPLDFSTSGTTLTWNGLRMDGVLEVGDILHVRYRRST